MARVAVVLAVAEHVVADAIDQLCAIGLVQREPGAVWPVDPEVGFQALLDEQYARVLGEQQRLADSRRAVDRWLEVHRPRLLRRSTVGVERLDNPSTMATRLRHLAESCTQSAWSFHAGDDPMAAVALGGWLRRADSFRDGVSRRAVYLDCVRTHPTRNREARLHADSGAEVRTVPSLPLWLLVLDGTIAVVPADDERAAGNSTALVVSEPGLVAGLAALFSATWRHGAPSGQAGTQHTVLNARERHALELWVQGHTDTTVAKRLDVSERTVRRLSESVARRLGARSRVEAAVRAVELGILRASDLA